MPVRRFEHLVNELYLTAVRASANCCSIGRTPFPLNISLNVRGVGLDMSTLFSFFLRNCIFLFNVGGGPNKHATYM